MSKEKVCGIYCIENLVNKKKYIGKSVNINKRWYEHNRKLNLDVHDNIHLQRSWNRHGKENFRFYIIEECLKEQLNEKEKYYISFYKTCDLAFGYNMTLGGDGCEGFVMSQEARNKISLCQKGKHLSNERKEKLKQVWKEKVKKGYKPVTKHFQRYNEIKKMSVYYYQAETGETLGLFESIHEASRQLNIEATNISKVLQNKYKHCNGYYFSYQNEHLETDEVILRSGKNPIYETDINGVIIQLYPNAKIIADKFNLDPSTIVKVCREKKKSVKGHYFKYALN